ncbi:hypothetical protein DSLASN_18290 [Desulfoluna limicola]|uniref:Uncharacterized protein n=1 Tax=Desulfoluna limicola TaxID=2810562 RepID=A0ABM7PGD4_9BACT|nr:hypothetical protein DSLASN_18290 [Desulfoluna limicola]
MYENLFIKRLAPVRATGGIFNRAASGGKVSRPESWGPKRIFMKQNSVVCDGLFLCDV